MDTKVWLLSTQGYPNAPFEGMTKAVYTLSLFT